MEQLPTKYPHLTPTQLKAVAALFQGASLTAAAKAAGVHRCTVYEWRSSVPEFVEACTEARFLAITDTLDELKDLSRLALQNLKNVLTDQEASPNLRVKASLAILNRLESTHHEGWALPLPIQEADHTRTERELLHRDNIRIEQTARDRALTEKGPRPNKTRHNPTQIQKKPLNIHPDHFRTSTLDPCHCGSGLLFYKCCFTKPAAESA